MAMGQAQKKFSVRIPLNPVDELDPSFDKSKHCYLMNNDIKQGPYVREEVDELINENPHLTAHIIIVDLQEDESGPNTVNIQSITNDVYLLSRGQKTGPFPMQEIVEKVEAKDILFTDFISLDGGRQWLKVSDHDQFNRRSSSREETLPTMPQDALFAEDIETNSPKDNQEEDALIGLAYVGKHGDKTPDKILKDADKSILEKQLHIINWSKVFKIFFLFGLVCMLALGIKFYLENRNATPSTKDAATPVGKAVTPKNIKPLPKKVSPPPKRVTPPKPAAKINPAPRFKPNTNRFKKSAPFKANNKINTRRNNRNNIRKNNIDPDYNENYQGDEPIELDPIQQSLDDDVVNPKGNQVEELMVDDEFINEINDAVEEELFQEELDF